MDFKTYVKSVVASYVNKQDSNVIFIKHYNTLDITKKEILADVDENSGRVFLYHEYEMHEMHGTFAPFLQWIRQCYDTYYKGRMSVEYFLTQCGVYSMHIEPLAGYIRSEKCTRREDVLHFEIKYETYRMQQNIISILEYISKEHELVLILSKFHLAPYSTIRLFRYMIDQQVGVHAILMYNDEFIIADYKREVWDDLFRAVENQDLQLEWGSLDSEKTMDVQDDFWFEKELKEEYLLKLRNMYYTFSLDDAYYYLNDIMNRLDEKTIWLSKNEQIELLQLFALIDMDLGFADYALVNCDKLTDMRCHQSEDLRIRYRYYYICARAHMIISQIKPVEENCRKCVDIAEEMGDSFLVYKAEIVLWAAYCGIGKDIFEYDFTHEVDIKFVDKAKMYGFTNFLAYLYVFGFENDEESINAIANGEKEPYYFNLGIEAGTKIGNDNFLMNAYMKNIILYSRAGHHSFVREMYKKRLEVLRRPNPLREAHMLAGLGYNSIIMENYEKAHSYLMQSVLNLTDLEKPDDVMNSLYNLAMSHFVAEDYRSAITVIELIIKMMKEMGYRSINACSTTKLYSLIAASCYFQREFYNTYYFVSKIEVIVEHMLKVLQDSNEGSWDEDFLLYHLVKGMLYNYENKFELCQEEFDQVHSILKRLSSARFFVVSVYATEQASLYLKQGLKEKADEVIAEAIAYCEEEGYERKKRRLKYFAEHGARRADPIVHELDSLPVERILQISKQAGTQIKLTKREKDIKFLTVLQEAISRENMSVTDLYQNTSAVIRNSYSLDDIIILRRKDGKREIMQRADADTLSNEDFDKIFDFFRTYKQAFLTNRVDKNFTQFAPVMKPFSEKHIMTMVGIPILEQSGTENVFLGIVKIKRRTVGGNSLLSSDDLMILKFAFSQFCEMMRRIDSRLMIESMNKQLEQSAITDHLTGIMNRSGFSKQAEIICSQSNRTSNILIYLDLDNFKYYNDTFGHEVGDLVLVTFAEIFKRMTRGKGLAVRYGGDEFIILLYDKTDIDGIRFAEQIYSEISDGLVDRISEKLGVPITIPENRKISCSIGIASFKGGSKDEMELALNRADQMLYDVKRHGKSHYKLYDGSAAVNNE